MSNIAEQLQKFSKQKFEELNLKRKDFIKDTGISLTTTSQIFNADLRNPNFNTILKMANYFNCSLDEVTGRDMGSTPAPQNYADLSQDQINRNLQNFINDKLQATGLNQYQLGRKLGFNHNILYNFMQDHDTQKNLSSAVIISMADYFNVPLDEMIGRTSPTLQKAHMTEKEQTIPGAVQKLNTKDMESLKQIKDSVSVNKQTVPSSSKTAPSKQQKNNKDRVR
jgi:transcriptional regulator with XRE-family HTH domain